MRQTEGKYFFFSRSDSTEEDLRESVTSALCCFLGSRFQEVLSDLKFCEGLAGGRISEKMLPSLLKDLIFNKLCDEHETYSIFIEFCIESSDWERIVKLFEHLVLVSKVGVSNE